jgi:hypothetical protein
MRLESHCALIKCIGSDVHDNFDADNQIYVL